MGAHAYAVVSSLDGLATTAFTWSSGGASNKAFLNDGRLDKPQVIGSSVASGINLIIDMGTAKQLTGFAVLNSNAAVQKTDATLKVEASSDAAFASDVNTAKAASTLYSSASPRNKDHVLQWNANHTKRYWRLTWTWTGSVTNFQIGELYAFTASTLLTRRSIFGSGETHEAIVAAQAMQYGETRSLFLAGPVRQLDLQWDDLTAPERDELYNMHALSSFGARPLLWIQSYESTATAAASAEQECIFGKLTKPAFQWSEKDFSLYQPGGFSIRSLGREAGA
jgi:hypothetical protein